MTTRYRRYFTAVDSSLFAFIFGIFLLIERADDENRSVCVASVEEDVFARVLTIDAVFKVEKMARDYRMAQLS